MPHIYPKQQEGECMGARGGKATGEARERKGGKATKQSIVFLKSIS